MLPIPTRDAIAAFAGAVFVLAVGLALRSSFAITMASTFFVGLALVLGATMPLGRRLRRERLEFAWWLDHGTGVASGAVIPQSPFDVRCYVRHRGSRPLDVSELEPLLPESVSLVGRPRAIRLDGRTRTEFRLRLAAPATGRVVLHGLAIRLRGPLGLFDTPLYFPNPLVIKVLPRAAARQPRARSMHRHASMARAGRTMVRHRGGGTELHELREFLPGDPFKSIAWKASARRGRLMIKEVEQEVQETRWLLVDISGTMRGGPLGGRKLDFALEAAAAEAVDALESGDRVGLLTFDSRLVAHAPPGEGKAQRIRIYDALLASTEIVDEDLTDIEDGGLVGLVARYVRQQDGIDFERRGEIDVAGLLAHARKSLGDERERDVQASSPLGRTLRQFCQARGLPLPHRADADHRKTQALAQALQLVGGRSRSPTSILVCTDFDGVLDPSPVVASLKLVRAHGHRVAFVLPDGRGFASEPTTVLERDLSRVYGRSESRRLAETRSLLGKMGIVALVASAGDSPALIAGRARGARRAA
ncbi:MAG: DUF58 domain-containing protein [Myxococcota bacterium]